MTREQVILEARTWLGTPYVHQGRLKGVGVDCVGLVTAIASFCGVQFEDCLEYRRDGAGQNVEDHFARWLAPVDLGYAETGDVVTFWVRRPEHGARHCGVLTQVGLLHTHAGVGRVVEHGWGRLESGAGWWRRRLRAFRFPTAED